MKNINVKIGLYTALISFILGTCLLGLYYQTSSDEYLGIGLLFVVITIIINSGVLLFLIYKLIIDKKNRKKLLLTCFIMLLNIPIMLFYYSFVDVLLNTMRIKFTNTTPTVLTDIKISGCETKHIDKLEPGKSKTVWIGIPGDCSIDIYYISNNKKEHRSVYGYTTKNSGMKFEYNIGGVNNFSY